jgi:hypothetical protein
MESTDNSLPVQLSTTPVNFKVGYMGGFKSPFGPPADPSFYGCRPTTIGFHTTLTLRRLIGVLLKVIKMKGPTHVWLLEVILISFLLSGAAARVKLF